MLAQLLSHGSRFERIDQRLLTDFRSTTRAELCHEQIIQMLRLLDRLSRVAQSVQQRVCLRHAVQ